MQQDDKKILIAFGKHLKKLREEQNKSLNEFAFNSELLTSATLSRIENGIVDFKFTTLCNIAKSLDINMVELFRDFE